ncbi:hypothetical protein QYF36_025208 [Acer negundo]|nr:hypothetical protein QYF36_025208 [Acer negundo]
MLNLRFLKFYSSDNEMNSKVQLFQGTVLPSTELSYFYWHAYPLKSLPSYFDPGKLCALHLPYSNLEQLPDKHFDKLKYINLSHSKLTKIPDIPVAPSLESLILEGCNNLLEIPSSIGYLDELMRSSETRLLERVSGGDIRIQALRTPDHLKRGCVGGMGEQRLVELEDTVQALAEQVNNNMRRDYDVSSIALRGLYHFGIAVIAFIIGFLVSLGVR